MLCCLVGHKKKYVGIEDYFEKKDFHPQPCAHGWHSVRCCDFCWNVMQIARWVCERCPKMGEDYIHRGDGVYTVNFGKLVPDEKKWANYKAL